MSEAAKPEDHKPARKVPFKFKGKDGKFYTLPSAAKGVDSISGRTLRDASMGGEEEQLKLGFILLEASGVSEKALNAFYDLKASTMLEQIEKWMYHDGDPLEATVPQS